MTWTRLWWRDLARNTLLEGPFFRVTILAPCTTLLLWSIHCAFPWGPPSLPYILHLLHFSSPKPGCQVRNWCSNGCCDLFFFFCKSKLTTWSIPLLVNVSSNHSFIKISFIYTIQRTLFLFHTIRYLALEYIQSLQGLAVLCLVTREAQYIWRFTSKNTYTENYNKFIWKTWGEQHSKQRHTTEWILKTRHRKDMQTCSSNLK